jgi:hypothetical protein
MGKTEAEEGPMIEKNRVFLRYGPRGHEGSMAKKAISSTELIWIFHEKITELIWLFSRED